jgi:hypothetical protein
LIVGCCSIALPKNLFIFILFFLFFYKYEK